MNERDYYFSWPDQEILLATKRQAAYITESLACSDHANFNASLGDILLTAKELVIFLTELQARTQNKPEQGLTPT